MSCPNMTNPSSIPNGVHDVMAGATSIFNGVLYNFSMSRLPKIGEELTRETFTDIYITISANETSVVSNLRGG